MAAFDVLGLDILVNLATADSTAGGDVSRTSLDSADILTVGVGRAEAMSLVGERDLTIMYRAAGMSDSHPIDDYTRHLG